MLNNSFFVFFLKSFLQLRPQSRTYLNLIVINYLSIHIAQQYGERELKDVASGSDLWHAWSIFARRVQKLEAMVPIVHPAKRSVKIHIKYKNNKSYNYL